MQRVRIQLLEDKRKFNTDGCYDGETGRLECSFSGQIIKVWNEAGQRLNIQPAASPPPQPPKVQNG